MIIFKERTFVKVESSISGPLKPKENLCCTKDGKFRQEIS